MKNVNWEALYNIGRAEIEQMLAEELNGVVIRSYTNGNSRDDRREATEEEMDLMVKIGLAAICCGRYTKDIQHCTDTAEWILDELIDGGVNGYDTIYCPIKRVWNRMLVIAENGKEN